MAVIAYHNLLTEEEKRQVCGWKYPGQYRIYNLPDYEKLAERGNGLADPDRAENYYAFYDDNLLVGYINLVERANKFSVGIAVKPELCSQGYGTTILKTACKIARGINPEKPIGLQVRSWNKRAIKCYTNAGFKIVGDEYELTTPAGKGMFYRMVWADF